MGRIKRGGEPRARSTIATGRVAGCRSSPASFLTPEVAENPRDSSNLIFAPLRHTDKVDDGKPGEEGEPAHTRCHVGNGGTSALQQKHVAAGIVRRVRASTGSICEIHSVQSENGG